MIPYKSSVCYHSRKKLLLFKFSYSNIFKDDKIQIVMKNIIDFRYNQKIEKITLTNKTIPRKDFQFCYGELALKIGKKD